MDLLTTVPPRELLEVKSWAWNQPVGSREADWAAPACGRVGSLEPTCAETCSPPPPTRSVKGKGSPRGHGQTGAQITGQFFLSFGESGAGHHPIPSRTTPARLPGKPTGTHLLGQLPHCGNWPVVPDGSLKSGSHTDPVYTCVCVHKQICVPRAQTQDHASNSPICAMCCEHIHAPHARVHMHTHAELGVPRLNSPLPAVGGQKAPRTDGAAEASEDERVRMGAQPPGAR